MKVEEQFITDDVEGGSANSDSTQKWTSEEEQAGGIDVELVHESQTDARWPEAAVHMITTMFGAGVLGLPYAMARLSWAAGISALTAAILLSLYTARLLAALHQLKDGRRVKTLRGLARVILGKWGERTVVALQFFIMVSVGIIFTVAAGQSISQMVANCTRHNGVLECSSRDQRNWPWAVLFGGCMVFLAQVPSFHHLTAVSVVGSLAPVVYSGVAFVSILVHGVDPDRNYSILRGDNDFQTAMSVLGGVGSFFFAFGGQVVQNEITSTLKVPPAISVSMNKVLLVSYGVISLGYYAVAIAGYACFGNTVTANVMQSLPYVVPAYVANVCVVLHMAAGYQVLSMPVYQAMESRIGSLPFVSSRLSSQVLLRLVVRSAYVALLTLIAVLIPFFAELGGLIGGVGILPLCFLLPALMWQKYHGGPAGKAWRLINSGFIALFAAIALATTVASVYEIQKSANTFKLFA